MSNRIKCLLVISVLCFSTELTGSAPVPARLVPILVGPGGIPYENNRGIFDFVGNWIQQSDWFPIELNVPDTVTGIGQGISSGITNLGNGFNTAAQNFGQFFQGLPFFNRIPTQFRPRPYNYVLLMPTPNQNAQNIQAPQNQRPINFNPFANEDGLFSSYP